jgi:MFS family permease
VIFAWVYFTNLGEPSGKKLIGYTHQMSSLPLRKPVIAACLAVFLADIVWSLLTPTFSLFAQSLGASLSFIGTLAALTGLTQLVAAVPISAQTDRLGRRIVILIGFGAFALACILHAISTQVWMLAPARILFSFATLMVFPVCGVLLADHTAPRERGAAFGMLTSSMSAGAALGTWLAGVFEGAFGARGSYAIATGFAAAGLLITWRTLFDVPGTRKQSATVSLLKQYAAMRPLLSQPRLFFACVIGMLSSVSFSGITMAFFPLHAKANGISNTGVANIFAVRSLGSMFTRLPIGILSQRVSRQGLLAVAALALAFVTLAIGMGTNIQVFTILLVIEGIVFGTVLTVGQSYATEVVTPEERAGAVGLYQTASSLGGMLSPLLLGWVAEFAGISSVFLLVSIFVLICVTLAVLRVRAAAKAEQELVQN